MLVCAEFPDKPVTLIAPFAASGSGDKIARDLAEALLKPLGQAGMVNGTAGAGATNGSARVSEPTGVQVVQDAVGASRTLPPRCACARACFTAVSG